MAAMVFSIIITITLAILAIREIQTNGGKFSFGWPSLFVLWLVVNVVGNFVPNLFPTH